MLFAFQAIALVGAQVAQATAGVSSCSFSSGTLTVNTTSGGTVAFSTDVNDNITLNGDDTVTATCPAIPAGKATLTNTTEIDVNGDVGAETVSIDLDVDWGTINWKIDLKAGADTVALDGSAATTDLDTVAGALGIDLNDDGDLDATVTAVETMTATGGSGDDFISGGGSTITGGPVTTTFNVDGGLGDDDISGGTAADTLTGGGGEDAADYLSFTTAVTVDLTALTASGGGGSDTLVTIEDVYGSSGNDTLTGSATANDIAGGPGDDKIDGAGGEDTADFFDSEAAVTVDLSAGTATGDGTDTLKNMEDVFGSDFGDTITGDSGNNSIDGSSGSDWIDYSGDSGGVTVCFVTSTVAGDPCVAPAFSGGTSTSGDDTLSHMENAILGSGDDTFEGNAFSNVVEPNGGQNSLSGGGGGDTLDYSVGYDTGVEVNMAGGGTAGDSAIDFENVVGTDFADTIIGSDSSNTIKSRKGNDNVRSGSGDDTVRAGAGNDLVRAGTGDDDLWGQKGNDNLNGGKGSDFCKGGPGKDLIRGCESGHK